MVEHDVGGKLDLIQAPVVVEPELLHHRTVAVREFVQFPVQHLHPEVIGQFLRLVEVGNPAEGVIQYPEFDVAFAHLPRQNTMAVAVKLEPERTPRRHTQALAVIRLQIRFMALLVMPGFVAPAWLHRRKNAHQSRMLTAFFQNRFDAVFFPEALPAAYELNPDPIFSGDSLRVCAQGIA